MNNGDQAGRESESIPYVSDIKAKLQELAVMQLEIEELAVQAELESLCSTIECMLNENTKESLELEEELLRK